MFSFGYDKIICVISVYIVLWCCVPLISTIVRLMLTIYVFFICYTLKIAFVLRKVGLWMVWNSTFKTRDSGCMILKIYTLRHGKRTAKDLHLYANNRFFPFYRKFRSVYNKNNVLRPVNSYRRWADANCMCIYDWLHFKNHGCLKKCRSFNELYLTWMMWNITF